MCQEAPRELVGTVQRNEAIYKETKLRHVPRNSIGNIAHKLALNHGSNQETWVYGCATDVRGNSFCGTDN